MANNERKMEHYDVEAVAKVIGVNPEFLMSLIGEFVRDSSGYIGAMRKAAENTDMKNLSHRAHKFKGAAKNLRFNGIADILERIEKNAKNSKTFGLKEQLKEIEGIIEELIVPLVSGSG